MPTQVRYGIISTAQIALNRHVPAAKLSENSVITAISSRGIDKAQKAASDLGIPKAYGSYQEILDDPDIDAVINPLPNNMHLEWNVKAAEAGKHILSEKPLGITVDEVKQMEDAAEANGVLLFEGFTHRFNPQLRFAKQAIADGLIGDLTHITAGLSFSIADWVNNIRAKPELGGGGLLDAGCYAVSAVRFVVGEEPATAFGVQRTRSGVDSTFLGTFEFPGGALGTIRSSMEQERFCKLEAFGTNGTITVTHMFEEDAPVLVLKGENVEEKKYNARPRFAVQFDHFSDCVLNGKPLEWGREDAIGNAAALVALLESSRTKQQIKVKR